MAQAAAGGLQIVGGAMGAIGALQQGAAAQQAGEYNARIAEQNALLSRQQAASEEQRQRLFAKKEIGSIRAAYGASGVTGGSSLDVLAESAANAELDALNIRHGGEMRSQGYLAQARLDRMGGENARRSSRWMAASTLLGSAAQAAPKFAGA